MTIYNEILSEVERATVKFPTWPTDPLHALAVLGEEYGELNKAMLQLTYEPHKTNLDKVRMEAIQTAEMALRLAMSLDTYEYAPSGQHSQGALASPERNRSDIYRITEETNRNFRIQQLENTFRHYHKASVDNSDICATCELDLRDNIHERVQNG